MKKIYSLLLTAFVAVTAEAQTLTAEQFLRLQRKGVKAAATRAVGDPVVFPTVHHWVGQGADSAALVLAWHDGQQADTLVWGYRFNAVDNVTGAQMLEAIVKVDPALYARVSNSQYGLYVEALGYDRNGDASTAVSSGGVTLRTSDGWNVFQKSGFSTNTDATDHFYGGYDAATNKYFAYLIANAGEALVSSPTGATGRTLANGAVDVWSYQGWGDAFALSTYTSAPKALNFGKGVYVVNEDWYGHASGSVNFYDTEAGTLYHNVHQTPADLNTLGVTTQYGALYGGRLYLMSKQDKGAGLSEGSRLAIFNAATMQLIKKFDVLPNGADGRGFGVVNDTLAYVTTSQGWVNLNLLTNTLEEAPQSLGGQMGLVQRVGDYILVQDVAQKGIQFIKADNQVVVKTVTGLSFAVSKDGRIWVLESKTKLQAYDPTTLEAGQSIDLEVPADGAGRTWNAGTFFAANRANALYYTATVSGWSPTMIYRVDLDATTPTATLFADIATLAPNTGKIYGAAVRLRPEDDNLFVATFKDYGDQTYELVQLNAEGGVQRIVPFNAHYWFPALPVFTDSAAPVVATIEDQKVQLVDAPKKILTLSATDADSYEALTRFSATSTHPEVATAEVMGKSLKLKGLTAGTSQITVVADNGGLKGYTAFILTVDHPTAITSATVKGSLNVANGLITANDLAGETLRIYTLDGRQVLSTAVTSNSFTTALPAMSGTYVIKVGQLTLKVQR